MHSLASLGPVMEVEIKVQWKGRHWGSATSTAQTSTNAVKRQWALRELLFQCKSAIRHPPWSSLHLSSQRRGVCRTSYHFHWQVRAQDTSPTKAEGAGFPQSQARGRGQEGTSGEYYPEKQHIHEFYFRTKCTCFLKDLFI